MNRGAGRRVTFRNDRERVAFVELVSELDRRFEIEIHAYCLMSNHYHLLVRSRGGRLSEAMAWLGSQYTRWVNVQRDVDGAIFRGRFHSVHVIRDAHLEWLFRYVNANPLDLGWEQPLADYRWSGLAASLGRDDRTNWLHTEFIRERFGGDRSQLEAFVERSRIDSASPQSALAGTCGADSIVAAVATARAPGPDVNSDADVRAVTTYLSLAVGIPATSVATIAHLDERQSTRFARRAERRCHRPGPAADLVRRVTSLLEHEQDLAERSCTIPCLTPDGTEPEWKLNDPRGGVDHRVSDTGWSR